ncbi:DUF6233 domain-containing protein, partial [Streptomyces tendae]|uniref:DUF6233 domain-containing protein n=1 Tax=Streptomyces tendae TaxID=1932 RepID=UPI00367394F8
MPPSSARIRPGRQPATHTSSSTVGQSSFHGMRIWQALWVQRIDTKIAVIEQRQPEEEHGRRHRPAPAAWIVELGIGAGRPPLQVHAGDCLVSGKRRRPVDRDEARRLLTEGLEVRDHCQPDIQLHILDLDVISFGWVSCPSWRGSLSGWCRTSCGSCSS